MTKTFTLKGRPTPGPITKHEPHEKPFVTGDTPTDPGIKVLDGEVLLGEGGPTEAGYHAIEPLMECPKKFQLKMIRGMRKPVSSEPDHFALGRLFHAARARWFSLKFRVDQSAWLSIVDAMRHEVETSQLPVSHDAIKRAEDIMTEYMKHWSTRAKPTPVAAEYKLGPAPLQPNDPFFLFRTARLDDVSKYPEAQDQLCIGEAKTTSTDINDTINLYELHGQPLMQAVLWDMCPNGAQKYGPVAGVMLDVVKKPYGKDKPKFARAFVPITDYSKKWFVSSMRGYLKAATSIDWNADAPRNPSSCTRVHGRMRVPCEFRDLCRFGKSASSKYVLRDGNSLLTWKPSKDQEVAPWL